MKILLCLLLVISTVSGCYDVEIDKLTKLPVSKKIAKDKAPEKPLVIVKATVKDEKIDEEIKLLKEKISRLENVIEFQNRTIVSLQNLCYIYQAAIDTLLRVMESIERVLEV